MKFTLVVADGVHKGKVIPVPLPQFLIGRDPQCHLRPASAAISKRHCALLIRGTKVFVRDFRSTNGTFVNGQQIGNEQELHDGDELKLGPLLFRVKLETAVAVNEPTPRPRPVAAIANADDDESVAAMLLGMDDAVNPGAVDEDSVPGGSTVMEVPAGEAAVAAAEEQSTQPAAAKPEPAKSATGNTSHAAKAILDKYLRRPRA